MLSEGIIPDVRAYSTAITACGNSGRWEEALMLLTDMLEGDSNVKVMLLCGACHVPLFFCCKNFVFVFIFIF